MAKKGKREVPAMSTSSLPDIVFMLLFFFMAATTMREVDPLVTVQMPEAHEITELDKKNLVNIWMGKPLNAAAGPFPNPMDPLVAGITNKMKSEGKNAFKEFFVPEAFMELRQGLGRLIRSEEDSGKVLILDNRVVVEHYGKTFMRIWNNKQKVVGSVDDIKAALK